MLANQNTKNSIFHRPPQLKSGMGTGAGTEEKIGLKFDLETAWTTTPAATNIGTKAPRNNVVKTEMNFGMNFLSFVSLNKKSTSKSIPVFTRSFRCNSATNFHNNFHYSFHCGGSRRTAGGQQGRGRREEGQGKKEGKRGRMGFRGQRGTRGQGRQRALCEQPPSNDASPKLYLSLLLALTQHLLNILK